MSLLQKILDKREDNKLSIGTNVDPERAFQEFKFLIDIARATEAVEDIKIIGEKNENLRENVYAVSALIRESKSTIRIYSNSIKDSIYGRNGVMTLLDDWLSEDDTRKIKFLLKTSIGLEDKELYKSMYDKYINSETKPPQIEVKECMFKNIEQCKKNVAIFDEHMFKLKNITECKETDNCNSDSLTTIYVNFNSPSDGENLVKFFDKVFGEHSNVNTVPSIETSLQSEIQKFDNVILEQVIKNSSSRTSANQETGSK